MKKAKINIIHVLGVFVLFYITSQSVSAQLQKVYIDKNYTFQTIDGFGASDAWRCQFVGKNWPNVKREKIAEWLFSKEIDKDGSPKGIGLSIWRFNIGAGTADQGEGSGIRNDWRRAESFVSIKGNYNWDKQEGQQWFLKEAKSYGVEKFVAFSISAPVQWTKNGKGYNGGNKDGEINLKPEYFDDYAQFMVEFLKHFKSEGINFDYLSPINEPQWDWEKKSQEGTPATNDNILELTELLNEGIEKNNLSSKIVLAEAADLRWLYSNYGKPERGSQIDYFFNKNKNLKNLKSTISGHSYFTTWPVDSLIAVRQKLNNKLKEHQNLEYWQSEFCILENSDDIGGGHKRDLGMDTALYVARVIHADLTLANASSWQWWTALSNANYKDGLIYLDTGNNGDMYNMNNMKFDGNFHDSKLLWAVGNYSRFIRPKMKRIKIELSDNKTLNERYKDLMVSAYLDTETLKLVVVAINYGEKKRTVDFSGYKINSKYETSTEKKLEFEKITSRNIIFSGRTVNTLIGSLSF
ncbi:glycoside hydrolase [Algibacter pectinivorans]|uniref:O-Glycosyl hydrolase n=1 Tax=Algibacter pectinivorans TaxID=870482 RepID=A0A1I1Q5D1_9FLAO|nr:glycoside hydrolase [Algibacter pectinivorans]SFD17197.1 O-Glycosyl hydrolase [Algibacter pectinivorans]